MTQFVSDGETLALGLTVPLHEDAPKRWISGLRQHPFAALSLNCTGTISRTPLRRV